MVPMILLPFDIMITGSYFLNSIHTFSQRARYTFKLDKTYYLNTLINLLK